MTSDQQAQVEQAFVWAEAALTAAKQAAVTAEVAEAAAVEAALMARMALDAAQLAYDAADAGDGR